MALFILPILALYCVGYLVIPIGYVFFCIWIAWKEQEIRAPIESIIYAVISIGIWWLGLILGTRPFNIGSIFFATLVPDIGVAVALVLYYSEPTRYRGLALKSGVLYPLALGLLYLVPIEITEQQFAVLNESIRPEVLAGIYIMAPDTASEMVRQGYNDKSATITLYLNNTFTISKIPNAWIGGSTPSGYDTFSGTWNIQKWGGSKNDVILFTIRKLEAGSAWGSPDIWYESFKKDGYLSFPVNITRERGQTSNYALSIPIEGMEDQGCLIFIRQ